MPAESTVVHRLMVSKESLAVMAQAINALSLEKERFVRLKDVVEKALKKVDPATAPLPPALLESRHLEGAIPVHLRLSKETNLQLDAFKQILCSRLKGQCSVREAVVFCAIMMAQI